MKKCICGGKIILEEMDTSIYEQCLHCCWTGEILFSYDTKKTKMSEEEKDWLHLMIDLGGES